MDKIKTVKIKNPNGSVSEETYTIAVDARNVDMENGKELQETIGTINIDNDGDISNQLKNLKSNKINKIDIIDNLESNDKNKVLSANQGKEINDKLKKKPYYYNSIAEMKADKKLKAGDMAVTLGYYETNDGGGAEYLITNTSDISTYQEKLNNELYAKIIIKKDSIDIKQLGAYNDGIHDNYNIIQNAIKIAKNIYINSGEYYISHGILITNNINIISNNATIKMPSYDLEDNSDYAFMFSNVNYGKIENLNLYVDADKTGIPPSGHEYVNYDGFSNRNGINIYNSKNIYINNVNLTNFNMDIFSSAYSDNLGRNKNDNIHIKNIISNNSPMPIVLNYSSNVYIENCLFNTKTETGFGQHDIYCSRECNNIYINNITCNNDIYFGCAINILNSNDITYDKRNDNIFINGLYGTVSEIISINECVANLTNIDVTLNGILDNSHRYAFRVYNYVDSDIVDYTGLINISNVNINDNDQNNGLSHFSRSDTNNYRTKVEIDNLKCQYFTFAGLSPLTVNIKNSIFKQFWYLDNTSKLISSILNCDFINDVRTYFIRVASSDKITLIDNNFVATGESMTQSIYNVSNNTNINCYGNNSYNVTNFISQGGGINLNNNNYNN